MKIGILQTGHTDNSLVSDYGDFDQMFRYLLADQGFHFKSYDVANCEFPETVDEQDGWLITGSGKSVYEGLKWMTELEAFLRQAFSSNVPIVGICFGHQILAKALGGKVEKNALGWNIGLQQYEQDGKTIGPPIAVWHQDIVSELPETGVCIGSSKTCPNAVVLYGETAYSIQAHPEFSATFIRDLMKLREDQLPEPLIKEAICTMDQQMEPSFYADNISKYFKARMA